MNASSKWVEKKDKWIRGNTFISSNENRLVYFVGHDVHVKGIGKCKVGLLENINAIGSVMMTPLVVSVSGSDALFSKDGVLLSVVLDATLVVRDDEKSIRSICLFPDVQEQLIRTEIVRQFQAACSRTDFRQLYSATGDLSATLTKALSESVVGRKSSFNVLEIAITKLVCRDPQLAETLERKARDLEGQEVARREAIANEESTRNLIKLEGMRETARAESESRRREAEREQALKNVELLNGPNGLLILNPELAMRKFEIEMQNIRFLEEQITKREVAKANAEAKMQEWKDALYEKMLNIAFVKISTESTVLKTQLPLNTQQTIQHKAEGAALSSSRTNDEGTGSLQESENPESESDSIS